MNPHAPRHALGWLGDEATFRELTERARRLLALQADLARCAASPGLVAMDLDQDTLVVGTRGAAAAAKLRQLEPTIVAGLQAKGWNVRRIRFMPQPAGMAPPAPPFRARAEIPASALERLQALSEAATDPGLKHALAHLAESRRRGGRRAGG
jgi:hypothetical protein